MSGNHIGPEEAVDVFKALGAESAIGVHWGTFQLSSEAVNEPREVLDEVLKRERIEPRRFQALEPGQSLNVPASTAMPSLLGLRSEEHTSELQSLMRISYAVFCLKKKKTNI